MINPEAQGVFSLPGPGRLTVGCLCPLKSIHTVYMVTGYIYRLFVSTILPLSLAATHTHTDTATDTDTADSVAMVFNWAC